jgi:hypothetical protein
LDVHLKNGNLSTIKRIKHSIDLEKELGLPSLKKTLHDNLFDNRTQNQCELTALIRGGNFERCEKASREEFNSRA